MSGDTCKGKGREGCSTPLMRLVMACPSFSPGRWLAPVKKRGKEEEERRERELRGRRGNLGKRNSPGREANGHSGGSGFAAERLRFAEKQARYFTARLLFCIVCSARSGRRAP